MSFVIALAVRELLMTAEEALLAATAGGAAALRRTDIGTPAPRRERRRRHARRAVHTHIAYRPGESLACLTVVAGEPVWVDPDFASQAARCV